MGRTRVQLKMEQALRNSTSLSVCQQVEVVNWFDSQQKRLLRWAAQSDFHVHSSLHHKCSGFSGEIKSANRHSKNNLDSQNYHKILNTCIYLNRYSIEADGQLVISKMSQPSEGWYSCRKSENGDSNVVEEYGSFVKVACK